MSERKHSLSQAGLRVLGDPHSKFVYEQATGQTGTVAVAPTDTAAEEKKSN